MLDRRPLGATGLMVPPVGLGAMQLGDPGLPEADAQALLRRALELGAGLIDTARSYGLSEERIGRHIAHRRDEFILSTKVGYGVDGVRDWTGEAVSRGIDEARERLRVDVIDIVHLHSCSLDTLREGAVVDALVEAVQRGKVGLAAYSGENEALAWAVRCGAFRVIQASVNFLDQQGLSGSVAQAAGRGLGVLAKRPLATAPWRESGAEPAYSERFRAVASALGPVGDWPELALRFSAFAPGVSACLVGTRRTAGLEAAVAAVAKGPLPADRTEALAEAFAGHSDHWGGVI